MTRRRLTSLPVASGASASGEGVGAGLDPALRKLIRSLARRAAKEDHIAALEGRTES